MAISKSGDGGNGVNSCFKSILGKKMGIQLNGITGDNNLYQDRGDVGIGGTLTYEDVTNVDSIGVIVTARDGINVPLVLSQ